MEKVEAKKKTHLRLKIDLLTWHITPFNEIMNFQPQQKVTGRQFGFLCFVFIITKTL
jgi:hypothetical protein